jgi:hypothetical protein
MPLLVAVRPIASTLVEVKSIPATVVDGAGSCLAAMPVFDARVTGSRGRSFVDIMT